MSIRKWIVVVCDECYTENDSGDASVAGARVGARSDGWHRRKGRDLCSDCWDRVNTNPDPEPSA